MVSDRLAIQQPLKPKVQLSNQVLINCGRNDTDKKQIDSCTTPGGKINNALHFILKNEGIPDRTCMGFRATTETCSQHNMCYNCLPEKCTPKAQYFKYPIKSYYEITDYHHELKTAGPLACEFKDGSFGEIVAFKNGKYIVKRDLGTFHGDNGFDDVKESEIEECWGAQVGEPYRYIDEALAEKQKIQKEQEALEKLQKEAAAKTDAPVNGLPVFGVDRFEGSMTSVAELFIRSSRKLRDVAVEDLPANFSWLEKNLVTPVQSHHNGPGYCGACWTMASSSSYSDRMKIMGAGKKSMDVFVAPQNSVDCVKEAGANGCGGGSATAVFPHFQNIGTVDETCNAWVSGEQKCHQNGTYCKTCDAKGNCSKVKEGKYKVYKAASWGNLQGEQAMMNEIFRNGPIDCGIATPEALGEDLFGPAMMCDEDPKSKAKWEITHDISVLGWGVTEDGRKYWIIRNSWGTHWGDGGFAKVCRGQDGPKGNMLLESACTWVMPEL
uniref:Peptidase C1A papain C-terminal domain-containing protein n=1 Tax=Mucochytrium quahogii TaxID=96639 RepID=A0A7S2W268_9STRA